MLEEKNCQSLILYPSKLSFKYIETLIGKHRGKHIYLGWVNGLLNQIQKAQTKYRLNWTSNLKHFCFQGHHEESEKENIGTKKKYLKITWLIKDINYNM